MSVSARPILMLSAAVVLAGVAAVFLFPRSVPVADTSRAVEADVDGEGSGTRDETSAPPASRPLMPSLGARRQSLPPPRSLMRPRLAHNVPLSAGPPTGTFRTEAGPTTTVAAVAVAGEVPAEEEGDVGEPLVPLPLARAALELVGADPDAEMVWEAAINDPATSEEDRSDLIEDLNEVGIDPRNLTPDDLPLIVSRLALIEELAPGAMDQTNLDAFAEAYKDLVNMYVRVTGQEPPQ